MKFGFYGFSQRIPDVVSLRRGIISPDHPHLVVENEGGGAVARRPLGVGCGFSPGGSVAGIPDVVLDDSRVSPQHPHLVVENKGGVEVTRNPLGVGCGLGPGGSVAGIPDVVGSGCCVSPQHPHLVVEN